MNQAQWTGERMVRGDRCWSPLAVPLMRMAEDLASAPSIAATPANRVDDVLLASLRDAAAGGISFTALRELLPDHRHAVLYDALRRLISSAEVLRSGDRRRYLYAAVRRS